MATYLHAKILGNVMVIIIEYFETLPFLNYKSYPNYFDDRSSSQFYELHCKIS